MDARWIVGQGRLQLTDDRRESPLRGGVLGIVLALAVLVLLGVLRAAPASAESKAILSPASGFRGKSTNLSGSDFGRSQRVVITFGRKHVAKTRTRRNGSFKVAFTVPADAHGLVRVVSRSRSRRVINFFRVSTSASDPDASEVAVASGTRLRWAPRKAPVAGSIGIRGSRFQTGRRVRIAFGRTKLPGGRTRSGGRFAHRVVVPAVSMGPHRIRVQAGKKRLSFVLTVTPDPVVVAAGDIACDPEDPLFNAGIGVPSACHERQTADLVVGAKPSIVLGLGDEQYEAGALGDFLGSYNPTWGRFKAITRPVPGNHEYGSANAAGYFSYFGALAGDPAKGYYSFDLGAWHLIALNSNCTEPNVHCGIGFAQEAWLRADLRAHRNRCVLAYWHHPFFSSGQNGGSPTMRDLFNDLYEARADLVLVGHDHAYERFAPQTPDGQLDPTNGIREIVVGTGGRDLQPFKRQIRPNSEVRNADTFGVLELRLHRDSYQWDFLPEPGRTFRDSGAQLCH